jgi:hypothetical protein
MTREQKDELRRTGQIVLETIPNQYGKPVLYKAVRLRFARWFRVDLMCWASKGHDLGACNCVNHDPYRHEEINRADVLRLLQSA